MKDPVNDQAPVRRHVNISAQSGAQLELRLHWLTRALAVHGGYIVAARRRSTGSGRHMAAVAYEMPLPKFARPARGARPAGPGISKASRRLSGEPLSADGRARQEQGTSSSAV